MSAENRFLRRRHGDQGGYVAVLVAFFAAALLLPLCAISVDVARWYVEVQRVQNAADAAATAGVTYLPDDFASAKATAIAVATKNGYPNSGTSSVAVSIGDKPTQLVVTIRSTIRNAFGSSFGVGTQTLVRGATADFNGPVLMGSPCNAFGNEPPGTGTTDQHGPATPVSQIVAPPGGAQCTSNPQFWGAIAGPDTPKSNGDEIMTRNCSFSGAGCTGSTNDEFDPQGYFYVVRVGTSAVGTPVTLQIYDPAWVENGDNCENAPTGTMKNNMNNYTTSDGLQRYKLTPSGGSPNSFCTGDVNNGTANVDGITTSYGMRLPTDTYNPKVATPMTSCERQYQPYYAAASGSGNGTFSGVSNATLDKSKGKYNDNLAKVYHQWVKLCTFTPTVAGDYYLQVRTNVKLGGTPDGEGGYDNNPNVFSQTGDDTSVGGTGNNRFSLRITGAQRSAVSIAGYQAMGIYANYTGANTTFNLVRVVPAAATKTLNIGFYDVGDASNPGTVQVLPPLDSNMGASLSSCTGAGVVTGTITNCKLTNVSSGNGWNGQYENLKIPIPNSYTCNYSQAGGCWFRLVVNFPGGVNDTTTWTASIDGDPIRLIK
ncbi:MAG: pilus assembly protein TadG-related protein [Nocardioides sp.]